MTDVDALLHSFWRDLRDSRHAANVTFTQGAIQFAREAELLTPDQYELWLRRIQTCPGHDDEGGRSWCAYCGALPKEEGT